MKYNDGTEVLLGDNVRLNKDEPGMVVAILEDKKFDLSINADEWSYLKKGALVLSSKYGLFHYPEMSDEIEFVSRS